MTSPLSRSRPDPSGHGANGQGPAPYWLDTGPLRDANSLRGIGTYVRGLAEGFQEIAALDGKVSLDPDHGSDAQVRHWTTLGAAWAPRAGVNVISVYDLIPLHFPGTVFRAWRPHEAGRYLSGIARARRAQRMITLSEATKNDMVRLLRLPPERIDVVALGVGARFRPASVERNRTPTILYVGPASRAKNIGAVVRAHAALLQRASVQLWIVGVWSHRQRRRLWRMTQELGSTAHVRHWGRVDDDQLVGLYQRSHVLACPSRLEGFGLPVLEAMACGTPVVTSFTSSLPEVAGDAALQVDPEDAQAVAEAIWQVLSEPALFTELRTKGLARAKHFTWSRTAAATLAVYERALAGAR